MIQYILILFVSANLISCNSSKTIVQETNLSASYESWVAGVRGGGSGINFYVNLKTTLSEEIELKKVFLEGTKCHLKNKTHYIS